MDGDIFNGRAFIFRRRCRRHCSRWCCFCCSTFTRGSLSLFFGVFHCIRIEREIGRRRERSHVSFAHSKSKVFKWISWIICLDSAMLLRKIHWDNRRCRKKHTLNALNAVAFADDGDRFIVTRLNSTLFVRAGKVSVFRLRCNTFQCEWLNGSSVSFYLSVFPICATLFHSLPFVLARSLSFHGPLFPQWPEQSNAHDFSLESFNENIFYHNIIFCFVVISVSVVQQQQSYFSLSLSLSCFSVYSFHWTFTWPVLHLISNLVIDLNRLPNRMPMHAVNYFPFNLIAFNGKLFDFSYLYRDIFCWNENKTLSSIDRWTINTHLCVAIGGQFNKFDRSSAMIFHITLVALMRWRDAEFYGVTHAKKEHRTVRRCTGSKLYDSRAAAQCAAFLTFAINSSRTMKMTLITETIENAISICNQFYRDEKSTHFSSMQRSHANRPMESSVRDVNAKIVCVPTEKVGFLCWFFLLILLRYF